MACYVCSGAKLKCSMGSRESDLTVLPVRPALVRIKGNLMGTIMDYKPFVNIKPFGQCQSLTNPAVAAATSANYGRLQKMPCVPVIVSPWVGGKIRVRVCGEPTLLDNCKLTCMWLGTIEITDAGQDFVKEGSTSLNTNANSVKSEKTADDVAVVAGSAGKSEEMKDIKELTVKDFVEILKKIEGKQGYEAARHYASNDIDYWKINALAKKYVNETDAEKKEEQKDNDPNLMPSRFMLLYGADDAELRKLGNIDDHPDNFEGEPEHKICVEKLREGLILLGYEVEKTGPFDDAVYHAFLQYHWQHGRVKLEGVRNVEDNSGKPSDSIADKYGVFTWKYFEKHDCDHESIMDDLNTKYGDELLTEKGVDSQMYKPGISYHYPWVPFCMTMDAEYEEDEEATYKIYDNDNNRSDSARLIGEGTFRKKDGIKCLLPDSEDITVVVDGVRMATESKQAADIATTPAEEAEQETVATGTAKVYKKGDTGNVVLEINSRLAGFGGLLPDNEFTPLTEKGVRQFQEHYMEITPTGEVDYTTLEKIDEFSFSKDYTFDFNQTKCPCATGDYIAKEGNPLCHGFGNGRKNEYPGIHRSLLFILKALLFYLKKTKSIYSLNRIFSGYRCWTDNNDGSRHELRTSTNHMGCALDLHFNKKNKITQKEERTQNPADMDYIRR